MPFKKISGLDIDKNMSNNITVLNFYADWCGPCKMMAPIFEELGAKENITVLKVNVDNDRDIAIKYGVQGIPSTFIYKNKVQKFHTSGFLHKEVLEQKINNLDKETLEQKNNNVDMDKHTSEQKHNNMDTDKHTSEQKHNNVDMDKHTSEQKNKL